MNSSGVPVVMGRNTELALLDEAGREKARHRVPYGAKLLAEQYADIAAAFAAGGSQPASAALAVARPIFIRKRRRSL